MRTEKTIGIAGAGLMGTSTARCFAEHGFEVVIYDIAQTALTRGRELMKLAGVDPDCVGGHRVRYTCSMEELTDCTMVLESIVEKLPVKQQFWRELSAIVTDECILATNTSGLSISAIAEAVHLPKRFCGMHWFNPADLVPLVEIISGDQTAPETLDAVYEMAKALGKEPIRVQKDIPGFIANRLQLAILRESLHILEEGAGSADDIDRAMKYGLGFRYAAFGPFAVCDFGGLDTFHHIAAYLYPDLSDAKIPQPTLQALYDSGKFGVKSGEGFYDYSGEKAEQAIAHRDAAFEKIAQLQKEL